MSRAKSITRAVAAAAMVAVGVTHFVRPDGFVRIVPKFLPEPLALVYVSGVFEILGGLGLLVPRTRKLAGIGLIALYVAVFPANINMAMHDIQPFGFAVSPAAQWLRLPFQALFIWIAWWCSRDDRPSAAPEIARTT
jgi:uncharacterized membrane protein